LHRPASRLVNGINFDFVFEGDNTMNNQEYANKRNRILIVATGAQASYGDGEIILTEPTSRAGLKRAMRVAKVYHNEPRIVVPEAFSMEAES
jgi:hypothetical protein